MPRMLQLLACAASAAAAVVVKTPQGEVVGTTITSGAWSGTERFAGIPYAVPPLGQRRFTRSVENTVAWAGGKFDASELGPPCIQNPLGDPRPPKSQNAPPPSEDCLMLNIFRPSPKPGGEAKKSLPVMVYVFGGGLCGGYASNAYYDGSALAKAQDVIVVSVQYRLGALGFLSVEDFPGGGSGGMNGMYDVVVALQYLKSNIKYFGGNAEEVTLFGQSSGSYTICTLCVAPAAKGLFKRAVLQSGPCIQGPPNRGWGPGNSTYGNRIGHEVMRQNNVTSLAELRTTPDVRTIQWPDKYMNDLNIAPYFSGYFPDSFVVPGDIEALWASGKINPSELVVGHNSKDGTAGFYGNAPTLGIVPGDKVQTGEKDYEVAVRAEWGPHADEVLAQYPLSEYHGSPQSAFIQADADANVICPSAALARYAAANNRPVWMFEFAHYSPNMNRKDGYGCDNGVELDISPPRAGPEFAFAAGWATHGAETHFVFGTEVGADGCGPPNMLTNCSFDASERVLAKTMMAYWASFARSGSPNEACSGGSCTEWPKAVPGKLQGRGVGLTTQMLVAGAADGRGPLGPQQGVHKADCAFWAKLFNHTIME